MPLSHAFCAPQLLLPSHRPRTLTLRRRPHRCHPRLTLSPIRLVSPLRSDPVDNLNTDTSNINNTNHPTSSSSNMSTPTTTTLLHALTLTPSRRRPQTPYHLASSLPSAPTLTLIASSPQTIPSPFYPTPSSSTYYTPHLSSSSTSSAMSSQPTQTTTLPPPPPPPSPPQPSSTSIPISTTSSSTPISVPTPIPSESSPLLPVTNPDPTPTPSPSPLWPRLLLLLIAAVWGTNFPTVKILQTPPNELSAATASLARFALASLSLIPFSLFEMKSARLPFPRSLVSRAALSGLPVFVGYLTQAVALTETEAGKCAFMCSLAVVVVPLLVRVFPGLVQKPDEDSQEEERKSALSTWGAPLLAVGGVALLELAGASAPNSGDVWAGLQAIAFALGFILNEGLAREFPEHSIGVCTVQLSTVAALSFLWAGAEAWLTTGGLAMPSIAPAFGSVANVEAVLYAGVVSTALTVWLSIVALKRVSAGELAVLLSTEPMWAAAFSAAVLGENMGTGAIVGGALILLACLVNQADALGMNEWGVVKEARVGERASAVMGWIKRLVTKV